MGGVSKPLDGMTVHGFGCAQSRLCVFVRILGNAKPVIGSIELGLEQAHIVMDIDGYTRQKEWIVSALYCADGRANATLVATRLQMRPQSLFQIVVLVGKREWIS